MNPPTRAEKRRPSSMSHDNLALTRRWFDEIWNQRRRETIYELASPDVYAEMEGFSEPMGRDDIARYYDALVTAIPDFNIRMVDTSVDGGTVAIRWRFTGTHLGPGLGIPPTGHPIEMSGLSWFVWKDGLVARGWDRWNRGRLMTDLLRSREQELAERFGLTPRESQVAQLMAERRSHKEIARELGVKPNTARRHGERVLKKLGVSSRNEVSDVLGRIGGAALAEHASDLPSRGGTGQ